MRGTLTFWIEPKLVDDSQRTSRKKADAAEATGWIEATVKCVGAVVFVKKY